MRRAESSSGASITRGKEHESSASASTRTAGESAEGRQSRNVSAPRGERAVIVTPGAGARPGRPAGRDRVTISTAISPAGLANRACEHAIGLARAVHRLALRLPAELAGQPGRQPDRHPRRHGRIGREGLDLHRVDPFERLVMHGGSKNCATSSRQRARPNQALSRLQRADGRVEPQPERAAGRARVGQVEDQPRALVGQVAEERLVLRGSLVHQRTIGRSASSNGRTAPGTRSTAVRPGAEHDPLGADLGQARGGQMAKRRDLGRDLAARRRRDPRTTIARHGNRAITVSSTGRKRLTRRRPGTRPRGSPARSA